MLYVNSQKADAFELLLGNGFNKPLTLARWRTLGMLVGCGSLPRLVGLCVPLALPKGAYDEDLPEKFVEKSKTRPCS